MVRILQFILSHPTKRGACLKALETTEHQSRGFSLNARLVFGSSVKARPCQGLREIPQIARDCAGENNPPAEDRLEPAHPLTVATKIGWSFVYQWRPQ